VGWFLGNNLGRKKYWISKSKAGVHLEKGINLANDIHLFPKTDRPVLGKEYLKGAPKIAIDTDTKIEFGEETFSSLQFYMPAKSQKLFDFGSEKVVCILTESKKIFVIIPGKELKIVDFDTHIPIPDDYVMNLARLLQEEGVEN